jgi:hypothetical protein
MEKQTAPPPATTISSRDTAAAAVPINRGLIAWGNVIVGLSTTSDVPPGCFEMMRRSPLRSRISFFGTPPTSIAASPNGTRLAPIRPTVVIFAVLFWISLVRSINLSCGCAAVA